MTTVSQVLDGAKVPESNHNLVSTMIALGWENKARFTLARNAGLMKTLATTILLQLAQVVRCPSSIWWASVMEKADQSGAHLLLTGIALLRFPLATGCVCRDLEWAMWQHACARVDNPPLHFGLPAYRPNRAMETAVLCVGLSAVMLLVLTCTTWFQIWAAFLTHSQKLGPICLQPYEAPFACSQAPILRRTSPFVASIAGVLRMIRIRPGEAQIDVETIGAFITSGGAIVHVVAVQLSA